MKSKVGTKYCVLLLHIGYQQPEKIDITCKRTHWHIICIWHTGNALIESYIPEVFLHFSSRYFPREFRLQRLEETEWGHSTDKTFQCEEPENDNEK